jgi:hypothetical protein
MNPIENQSVPMVRLTEGAGHFFFGYYDVAAFDAGGKRHLYHRVGFMDRQPRADDIAELGLIDIETKVRTVIGSTTAWNFQQGSMLQWNPTAPDREVIYNFRSDGICRAAILDLPTGKTRRLDRPVAALDPKGRYALSLNFARLFDFRPGYGYPGLTDPNARAEAPDDDGVFRIDLADGQSRLLLSLADIRRLLRDTESVVREGKLVVNHLTFNPDGSRFVLLARSFPEPGKAWGTVAITANADGSDVYVLNPYRMTSHYHWRDNSHLLAYALHAAGTQLYLLRDYSQECDMISDAFFKADGHCSYSPDRSRILYDSYAVENYRHLYLYDVARGTGRKLASLYSVPNADTSIRCDLHPRWSPDGARVSFDSTHESQRHIYGISDL